MRRKEVRFSLTTERIKEAHGAQLRPRYFGHMSLCIGFLSYTLVAPWALGGSPEISSFCFYPLPSTVTYHAFAPNRLDEGITVGTIQFDRSHNVHTSAWRFNKDTRMSR